jgi:hypothetical protein
VPLAEVVTTFCLRKKDGLCRGVREPVFEVPSPFLRVQLVCGANTNNIGVMLSVSGEVAMPTDEDEERFHLLRRRTLPTFVLSAFTFILVVVGMCALWWIMISVLRR